MVDEKNVPIAKPEALSNEQVEQLAGGVTPAQHSVAPKLHWLTFQRSSRRLYGLQVVICREVLRTVDTSTGLFMK